MDVFDQFLTYAGTEAGERAIKVGLAVAAAAGAFFLWLFGVLGKFWNALFGKSKAPAETPKPSYDIGDHANSGFSEAAGNGIATGQVGGNLTITQGAPVGEVRLTIEQFTDQLEKARDKAKAELTQARDGETDQLRQKVAELERQLASPDASLAEAQKRVADLEARLQRDANEIGADRVDEARAALQAGDYSIADEIFAAMEARADLEIKQGARAAFGRGEVAEAEVRWADAAEHYGKAARLDPSFENLKKAFEFFWRSGSLDAALRCAEDHLKLARDGEDLKEQSEALNNLGLTASAQGRFAEAEAVYGQAMEIDRATIGEGHPNYAACLNNLASVVQAQGRFAEAEALYGQALEIGRAAIGEGHPNYAACLNNLAGVVQAQGRFAEAEELYGQALEIDRATIGEGHPDYATRLNNLANVVQAQGRFAEAEALYGQALEIGRATIGEGHPDYATRLNNLGDFLVKMDRGDEGRAMLEQALKIRETMLPVEHPDTQKTRDMLAALPDAD